MKSLKQGFERWYARQNHNDSEISLLDVKQLYDAAYEEKARARVCLKRFRRLMAQARHLDALYRARLEAVAIARHGRAA